jgi:DHA1 family multidrug resistance protein-like MFS transporter
MTRFDVSMTKAILGMSLYLFGIAFAPIYTPHLSESYGRVPVYLASLPIFMLFILGAGFSQNFASLAVCRFFAGLFGGPSLVLIEGTYADVWHAKVTGTYYAALALASYIGAAVGTSSRYLDSSTAVLTVFLGPLVGGFVFAAKGWRWTQWVTLMIAVGVYLFGIGVPETYGREIVRARARRHGRPHNLPKALSGITFFEKTHVTCLQPLKQITEPIVILSTIYLGFTFGVLFQFFISVPVVLSSVYNFTIQQVGLAFIAAIVGSLLAFVTSTALDYIAYPRAASKAKTQNPPIEYRMLPSLFGSIAIPTSLFWIGWTAKPEIMWPSPVLGTFLYVWGSMSVLISFIGYLFDAYPPAGTLSALTIAAVFRIICAGVFPLFIIQMITNLTGAWAMSTFGFIAAAMIPIPWAIWWFGERLRKASKYNRDSVMMMSNGAMGEEGRSEMGSAMA